MDEAINMEIELAFATENIKLELPDDTAVDQFSPATADQLITFDKFKSDFLIAKGDNFFSGEKLLFVINDGFRNTPTSLILEWLQRIDTSLFDKAYFLVSTGTHDAPSEDHYRTILGNYYHRLIDRVLYHNAYDYSSMIKIGPDQFGGDVWVNKAILENQRICLISSVEPHYFAGFTGGRKSVFPGLTDFTTVERNHNLANSLDAAPLKLKGNPVAEHLQSMIDMLDKSVFFSIQTVLDARQQLGGVFLGDVDLAFDSAATFAEKIYAHKVSQEYDVIICEILPPLDSNLYQAQKALENCQAAVKNGGTVVIVSACKDGVGSEHFWNLAKNWDQKKNVARDGENHFGSHKLYRVNSIRKRINVCLHSTLDDRDVRQVFYEPLVDIQNFLLSLEGKRKNYKMAIVHDAANSVLKV